MEAELVEAKKVRKGTKWAGADKLKLPNKLLGLPN